MAAILAAVGIISYALYSTEDQDFPREPQKQECCRPVAISQPSPILPGGNDYAFQQDYDEGQMRPKLNLSPYKNFLTDPNLRIVRSESAEDIYDPFGNAYQVNQQVREKNMELGYRSHFDQNNRKTTTIPSYNSKPVSLLLPNPEVFPGLENAWFVKFDRDQAPRNLPITTNAMNYKDAFGDYTTLNLPRDTITSFYTLGNPWGPSGVFNRAFVQGASRLDGQEDYRANSFPPMIEGGPVRKR